MNRWSKEDLEEMCGDDIIEQLAFLSGCHQHQLCNSNPSGWIISDESLRKFAELIVRKCASLCNEIGEYGEYPESEAEACAEYIFKHFGVEE